METVEELRENLLHTVAGDLAMPSLIRMVDSLIAAIRKEEENKVQQESGKTTASVEELRNKIASEVVFYYTEANELKKAAEALCRVYDLIDAVKAKAFENGKAEGAKQMADAAEMLWVVLANVSGGDWSKQSADWQEAAARWRDYYFSCLHHRLTPEEEALAKVKRLREELVTDGRWLHYPQYIELVDSLVAAIEDGVSAPIR